MVFTAKGMLETERSRNRWNEFCEYSTPKKDNNLSPRKKKKIVAGISRIKINLAAFMVSVLSFDGSKEPWANNEKLIAYEIRYKILATVHAVKKKALISGERSLLIISGIIHFGSSFNPSAKKLPAEKLKVSFNTVRDTVGIGL